MSEYNSTLRYTGGRDEKSCRTYIVRQPLSGVIYSGNVNAPSFAGFVLQFDAHYCDHYCCGKRKYANQDVSSCSGIKQR